MLIGFYTLLNRCEIKFRMSQECRDYRIFSNFVMGEGVRLSTGRASGSWVYMGRTGNTRPAGM